MGGGRLGCSGMRWVDETGGGRGTLAAIFSGLGSGLLWVVVAEEVEVVVV